MHIIVSYAIFSAFCNCSDVQSVLVFIPKSTGNTQEVVALS